MTAKTPTDRAYCVLRSRSRRAPGQWIETGTAWTADDGNGLRVYLSMLPVTGFDGHILLRPVDAKPAPPLPDSDDEDDDMQQPATSSAREITARATRRQ
jgi:hypothetical protein